MRKEGYIKLAIINFLGFIPDRLYSSIKYFKAVRRFPNLRNPKLFCEKILWLKLYDRNPFYSKLVDKYEVKKYISSTIGSEYIIPTIGVWDNEKDIDFNLLPDQFVLKCTHDSGRVIICKDKNKLNIDNIRKELRYSLKRNFYKVTREWPYKDVPRKIIAEQYMIDNKSSELTDYKFFCFNGKPLYCQVIQNRSTDETIDFFDMLWNRIDGLIGLIGLNASLRNSNTKIDKPETFEEMKIVAESLSKNIPFVRIDLYNINNKVYFSEFTFYPASGNGIFMPFEWNKMLGDYIDLPKK